MVEHRKYLPGELDYVLSRVAAGWKFDIIAKAFKQDFASHWSDRIFTKKQVQYIKNTYRRPPGTIQPYDGPIPNFSPSPPPTPHNHNADLQATIDTALKIDRYSANEPYDRQQTLNPMASHSQVPAWSSMRNNGVQDQQYVVDGDMGINSYENPYNLDSSNQPSSLLPNTSGPANHYVSDDLIDPMLRTQTGGPDHSLSSTTQTNALIGIGSQFPEWTQAVPTPRDHARFTGYASRLDTDPDLAVPSLDHSLLNSAAPDRLLSGEHADHLIQQPLRNLQYTAYGEPPADPESAQEDTPQSGFTESPREDTPASPAQEPLGCSLAAAAYTDRSGWWYDGHHDGWCAIPHEHRHDYDGGVHFRSYDSYTQNIYTEQNDHVTGYLLGLCTQLQGRHPAGEAVCLHHDCEEARRVAQELVDATLPEDHDLRQEALSRPRPAVIRLLSSLSDRLPEGFVYNPFTERVVRFDVPHLDLSLLFHDKPDDPTDHDDAQQNGPQQDVDDYDQKNVGSETT